MSAQEPFAYSVVTTAKLLGVGKSTVWEILANRELPAIRLRGRTLVKADDLRRYIESLPPARSGAVSPGVAP